MKSGLYGTEKKSRSGFTMVELLMVIVLVGVLSAVAVPSFLDFRKEGRAATVRRNLSALRIGVKNQMQNALVRCGLSTANPITMWGLVTYHLLYNDITYYAGTASQICTTTQVPNVQERKFLDIQTYDAAHTYFGGVDFGVVGMLPKNPFVVPTATTQVISWDYTNTTTLNIVGGPCGLVAYLATYNSTSHWLINAETGDVWAGTNTVGVNECSF